jgi:zinc protease
MRALLLARSPQRRRTTPLLGGAATPPNRRSVRRRFAVVLWIAFCSTLFSPVRGDSGPETTKTTDDGEIPAHPSKLAFPPFEFTAPSRRSHRHVIPAAGGVPAYVVEDRSLPLVEVEIHFRVGAWLDPDGLVGLAEATGQQIRAGGTENLSPEDFDEEADFLAAEISTAFGSTSGSARLECLTKDLDRGLDLFFEMLTKPRFDDARLALYKNRILQDLARRNDATPSIESREWNRLLFGASHFSAKLATRASIEALSPDVLRDFHAHWIHPANCIVAVSGDIDSDRVIGLLTRRFTEWKPGERSPLVPAPTETPPVGVWIVDKPDVNQGRVSLGHLGVRRDHPDHHAILLMNNVLGGGGFTSRITSRVRSDEGLAYSAGSEYDLGVYFPGEFRAYFQSKSASVARALEIVLDEIDRIRKEPITAEELDGARQYYLGAFPRTFTTAAQTARTFARDEIEGRSDTYWDEFPTRIRAVTMDDIQRVAREQLLPDRILVLIVGAAAEIARGDPDRPQSTLADLARRVAGTEDSIHFVPLPNPETLIYPGS